MNMGLFSRLDHIFEDKCMILCQQTCTYIYIYVPVWLIRSLLNKFVFHSRVLWFLCVYVHMHVCGVLHIVYGCGMSVVCMCVCVRVCIPHLLPEWDFLVILFQLTSVTCQIYCNHGCSLSNKVHQKAVQEGTSYLFHCMRYFSSHRF